MITEHSNFNINPKKAACLGDMAVFHGWSETQFFGLLFSTPLKAFGLLFKQFLRANQAIGSYAITAVLRVRHGQYVCGILLIKIMINT